KVGIRRVQNGREKITPDQRSLSTGLHIGTGGPPFLLLIIPCCGCRVLIEGHPATYFSATPRKGRGGPPVQSSSSRLASSSDGHRARLFCGSFVFWQS